MQHLRAILPTSLLELASFLEANASCISRAFKLDSELGVAEGVPLAFSNSAFCSLRDLW